MHTQDAADGNARPSPIYVRIQERVRSAIAEGTIRPGDRIWSELELSNDFNTTRATVRHALDQLVYEGLVTRQAGRGSFVATQNPMPAPIDSRHVLSFEEQVAQTGKSVTYRSPKFMMVPAPRYVAQRFGIAEGADVFELERVRLIDDVPVGLETRFIPEETGRQVTGDMLSRMPAHTFVGVILGEALPTILVSITAEIASEHVSQKLELPEKVAVSVRTSAHYNSKGQPVLLGRCIFAGNISTDYVLGQPLSEVPLSD
jgi:GntR family transcriptional regulator